MSPLKHFEPSEAFVSEWLKLVMMLESEEMVHSHAHGVWADQNKPASPGSRPDTGGSGGVKAAFRDISSFSSAASVASKVTWRIVKAPRAHIPRQTHRTWSVHQKRQWPLTRPLFLRLVRLAEHHARRERPAPGKAAQESRIVPKSDKGSRVRKAALPQRVCPDGPRRGEALDSGFPCREYRVCRWAMTLSPGAKVARRLAWAQAGALA